MPEPAAAPRTWTVGPYRPGDEHEILALFNAGFGKDRSLATWAWRFQRNPYGGPFASLARRTSDGMLVGTYLCLPFKLAADGVPMLAFQVVDLVVHSEYRKQGMFEQMAKHSYAMLAAVGGRAEVAFPNPDAMSYPGFTRTLGWTALAELKRFTLRLDLERPLRALLRIPALARAVNSAFRAAQRGQLERQLEALARAPGAPLEFRTWRKLPPGCDALWDACLPQYRLSFWKDAEYLRWRYDEDPEFEFTYAGLMRAGELVALAVVFERDGVVTLCELLVAGADVHAGRRLLGELRRLYAAAHARTLVFLGPAAGSHARMLAGFSIGKASENVLVGCALDDGARAAMTPAPLDWNLAYGDADFV